MPPTEAISALPAVSSKNPYHNEEPVHHNTHLDSDQRNKQLRPAFWRASRCCSPSRGALPGGGAGAGGVRDVRGARGEVSTCEPDAGEEAAGRSHCGRGARSSGSTCSRWTARASSRTPSRRAATGTPRCAPAWTRRGTPRARSSTGLPAQAAAAGGSSTSLPRPDAGEHAPAACAGLENLARTLSIEWARHGITTVTIAPGAETPAGEVAALTAYLASPAGAYFSGCLLDLRGP